MASEAGTGSRDAIGLHSSNRNTTDTLAFDDDGDGVTDRSQVIQRWISTKPISSGLGCLGPASLYTLFNETTSALDRAA